MADPYLPPQGGPYQQDRTPRDPAIPEPRREIPVATERSSGFGTGTLVALVFVVIAILVAVFYQRSDSVVQEPAPATEVAPVDGGATNDDAATGDTTVTPDAAPEAAPDAAPEAAPDAAPADPAEPQPAPPASDSVEP